MFWHKDGGEKVEGWAMMGEKAPGGGPAFVVDRFIVQAHFGTESFPETYYCDDIGITWQYADE